MYLCSSYKLTKLVLKEALLKEHSRRQATGIAAWIGTDKKRFRELMDLFFLEDYRISQRAAWVMSFVTRAHPELATPYLDRMLHNLSQPVHDAVKRNTLRILQDIVLPASLCGLAAERCFALLRSSEEPVAIRAFSMTVLLHLCQRFPELAPELQALVEDMVPYGSAAIRSRGQKTLKALKKIQYH